MKLQFKRISVTDGVDNKIIENAKKSAQAHQKGNLPSLNFTESNPDWVLLYDHARLGQIDPKVMKYMKRVDLYFLAGLSFPHPKLAEPRNKNKDEYLMWDTDNAEERWDQLTKLQGNAVRAKAELERRSFIWTSAFVVLAALVGAIVGSSIQ